MTNPMTIKAPKINCKGNVKSHYEQMPNSLRNYTRLRLISGNELSVYFTLLSFVHKEYGYAFPTTKQLALETGLSDRTVKQSVKNLETVGLIGIAKAANYANKNRYFVYLPLEKDALQQQAPHLFAELAHRTAMYDYEAKQDKERLSDYLNEEPQAQQEQQTPVTDHYQQLAEEAERNMLNKMAKLSQGANSAPSTS